MKALNDFRGRNLIWYSAASFLMAAGRAGSVKFYEDARITLSGRLETIFLIVRFPIYFVLFLGMFALLHRILRSRSTKELLFESGNEKEGKPWEPYLVLAGGWLPLLLIKYPAAVCWDTLAMVEQYRKGLFSEHHSVYYTLIMGKLVELGEVFGHPNYGMFAFSVIHYAVLVAALGWSVGILRKMGVRRSIQRAVLLMYLLNPYISGYVGVIIKDELYTAFIVLFFLCMVELFLDHEAFAKSPVKLAVMFVSVINIWLIRKNGSYILLATAVLLVIRSFRKRLSKRPVLVLLAALIVSAVLYSSLGAFFHAEKGSVAEALSLPFQQTARYVKYHGNEVTEEEREAIDAVLPYDELAEAYDPRISDPVKGKYRGDSSKLGPYFKVWLAQLKKHPLTYVSATWDQNHYLFMPEADNVTLYTDLEVEAYGQRFASLTGLFGRVDKLVTLKKWIVKEFELIHRIPLIRYLGNVSFWFYILMFATVLSLVFRADDFVLLAFSWFSVVFVVLGPVIQLHPRYMFPVVYVMPVTVLFMLRRISDRQRDA